MRKDHSVNKFLSWLQYFKFDRRMAFGLIFVSLFILLSVPTKTSFFIGIIIAGIGEAIRFWSAGYLHKKSVLTTAGPYAMTRNPLYFGSFLIGCGYSIVSNNVYLFASYLIAYALIYSNTIKKEEKFLEKEFGDEFLGYKHSVPIFLPNISNRGIPNKDNIKFSWKHASSFKKNAEIEGILGYIGCSILFYYLLNAKDPHQFKLIILLVLFLFLIIRWFYYFKQARKLSKDEMSEESSNES